MALHFKTTTPNKLLSEFKKAIDENHVITWSYDSAGDFTHTPEQWKFKAWLRPRVDAGVLTLYIVKPKISNISSQVYAIYHGRFIESMLVHCDKLFTSCDATALPSDNDMVS